MTKKAEAPPASHHFEMGVCSSPMCDMIHMTFFDEQHRPICTATFDQTNLFEGLAKTSAAIVERTKQMARA